MATITFLQAVNATLKRVRVIQGDAEELATSTVTSTATGLTATGAFTDSSRQTQIDLALQVWNEAIHEVFSRGMFAPEAASATLVLVEAQREYSMPSDFERFAGDTAETRAFRGATQQWLIYEHPRGYAGMLAEQPGSASQWRGQPNNYAISPVSLQTIRVDMEPTSDENGMTFNALYEKRISRTSTMATETMPFADTVTDALVPVTAEAWMRIYKKEFDSGIFSTSVARAMEFMGQRQRRTSWGPLVGR